MIVSREFLAEDIPGIDEIFKSQSGSMVPSLRNVVINSTLVDDENGRILGYGAVKLFAEAIFMLDKKIKRKEKAQALREAMKTAIVYSKDKGLEYLYAICEDEKFSRTLMKSYNFRETRGKVLILDLE